MRHKNTSESTPEGAIKGTIEPHRSGFKIRSRAAILFSDSSREAYIAAARQNGELYTFVDAWGENKTWVKGDKAYLAPNAVSTLLLRSNIKHDWLNEDDVLADALSSYNLLVVANAGHLPVSVVKRIVAWTAKAENRLLVTGRTNLPNSLLGLDSRNEISPYGYTGWMPVSGSPLAGLFEGLE